jgi:hypothetical protein
MRDPLGDEERLYGVGDLVRAVMRYVAPVRQATAPLGVIARQPLVADAPAHPVAGAELAHREAVALRIAHELQSLVHRSTLPPWHRRPLAE